MFLKKIVILIIFCLVCASAFSQHRKTGRSMYTRDRYNANAARVRGSKAKTVCPVFENSRYPFQGIGLKLGDPFAITAKYYFSKKMALAADVGKPASSLYSRYFRQEFQNYAIRDTFSTDNASLLYLTHKVKSDLVYEFKVLYHFDAKEISPGLQVYIGGGWQWKTTKIEYDYSYISGSPNRPDAFGKFQRTRLALGPQGVLGIEYSYFQIPISAFMELEYFTDIQADPGRSRVEGGVGLRYIF
jgi:hypothetical protein